MPEPRLVDASGSGLLDSLPDTLRSVLSQPLVVLGAFFVVVVYFAPSGLTGLGDRVVRKAVRS